MAQELEDLDIVVVEIEEKISLLKGEAVAEVEVEGQKRKLSSSSPASKLQDSSKAPRLDLQAAMVGEAKGPAAL